MRSDLRNTAISYSHRNYNLLSVTYRTHGLLGSRGDHSRLEDALIHATLNRRGPSRPFGGLICPVRAGGSGLLCHMTLSLFISSSTRGSITRPPIDPRCSCCKSGTRTRHAEVLGRVWMAFRASGIDPTRIGPDSENDIVCALRFSGEPRAERWTHIVLLWRQAGCWNRGQTHTPHR